MKKIPSLNGNKLLTESRIKVKVLYIFETWLPSVSIKRFLTVEKDKVRLRNNPDTSIVSFPF